MKNASALILGLLLIALPPATGQEKDSPDKKKVETLEIEKKPFEKKTNLSGMVTSAKATPIAIHLEEWSNLTVLSSVEHGEKVKKGDIILELETDDLEEKIEELAAGLPLAEIEIVVAKAELANLEKTSPIEREKSARSLREAVEDLAYFEEVDRAATKRDAEETARQRANYLSYAEEELRQLKKMYEADDMTEETEEIILQRAQNSVDAAKWELTQAKKRAKETIETSLPRREISLSREVESKRIDDAEKEKALADELTKKRLELEKKVADLEKAKESLAAHKNDLAAITLTAPHDGIVYYGASQRGKWKTASKIGEKLFPGGSLSMREVVMTIVDPTELQLTLAVPEDKLRDLAVGQTGTATPKWNPDLEMVATVEALSMIPHTDSTFDAIIALEVPGDATLFPGMKAEAEIVVYKNAEAILIPSAAITEEDDEEFVTLAGGEKKEVETGRQNDKSVEDRIRS